MSAERAAAEKIAESVLWFFRFTKGWLHRILGVLASIILVVWGALASTDRTVTWLLVVGIGVTALAVVAEFVVQRPSYMELAKQLELSANKAETLAQALESSLCILLVQLGRHCELDGHHDRLSVYYFHDGRFFMVARHSRNPVFKRRGRESYSANEGVIGRVWNTVEGQAVAKMPAKASAWKRAAERQGISAETANGISMQSLGLGGYRLSSGDDSVGVLMIESTIANRISQTHLDKIGDSHIVSAIEELVAGFALMTPAGEKFTEELKPAREHRWQAVPDRGPTDSKSTAGGESAAADGA